ncbi:hypothetical protein GGR04_003968 [Aureimonas pseudogalii]|uniref:Uncharacterized protein n=1 Tax=Aureimonas pseudogalii TaxID=1744844 RepID=A0A7W6MLS3_9HYPH|nr:hypothetical protein [Aureimonas pseudogalii]
MTFEEERQLTELARILARGRELASSLSIPFATKLIDLSLVELAIQWQGRDPQAGARTDGCGLDDLLQIKLRLSVIERASGAKTDRH